MMLSRAAYEVGSVLVAGAATVHELKASVATAGVSATEVDGWLLGALLELVASGYVTFLFEPRYGDLPPIRPAAMTPTEFESLWGRAFGQGVRGEPESSSTVFVECTDGLVAELQKEDYSRYQS